MKTNELFKKNYLKIISLLMVQLFFTSLHAKAASTDQLARVTLELKKVTLKTVFNQIENQTDFTFFYENDIVDSNKKVSINADNMSVDKVLEQVLSETDVVFKIIDKQIVITKKIAKASKRIINKGINKTSAVVKSITGQVTSTDGLPLPGVSIIIKGTQKGTETDFDGNYRIDADAGDVLEFSSLGFKTKEVVVASESVINIQLEEDIAALNEVVLIGYGTAKKSDLTGAVGVIDSKELAKFPVSDAGSVIQGRVSGVRVESAGGAPGANQLITIRGQSTLSNNGPLYVIDGVFAGNMSSLNPADIESISVLKDASSLAIYGSRGANGVIIIKTKTGKKGKLSIDIESSYGFQKAVNTIDYANARQYADIVNRANDNDGEARVLANDAEFNPNIDSDIQRASLRTAPISNTNVRLSGGGENLTYSMSANLLENEGIVRESDFTRKTLRLNTGFEKGRLKVHNNIGLSQSINNPNPYFNRERDLIPTIPIRNPDGSFAGVAPGSISAASPNGNLAFTGPGNVINSLALATLEDRTVTNNNLIGNVDLSFEIFKGLTYKANLGLNYNINNNFRFRPSFELNPSDGGRNETADFDERNRFNTQTTVDQTLNYKRAFGKHSVDVVAGFSEVKGKFRILGLAANDFVNEDFRVAQQAQSLDRAFNEETRNVLQSYLGRANYIYDDRYLVTASVRRDATSLFAEENRVGVYKSFAVAWNLSNESFMEDFDDIQDIKLRVSYGDAGSNNVGPNELIPGVNLNTQYTLGVNQDRTTGFAITETKDPNIGWEKTESTDIGLEFKLLNKKIDVVMDYFEKKSSDILVRLIAAPSGGTSGEFPQNSASIKNTGFEFAAGYTDNIGELNFNVAANFSILNNEVTSLGKLNEPITSGGFTSNGLQGTRTDAGQPVGSFYGYVVDGIYQSDAEAAAANDQGASPVAGDLKFRDINGDGQIDEDDQTYIGNPAPNFEYGLNINLDYKNFDMTLFFNGVSGKDILNGIRYRGFFDTEGNYLAEANNGWRPDNTNTNIPRNTKLDAGNNRRMSDFYIEDGSYFRLRNIQIGYSIPRDLIKTLGMTKFRIYASAQNLFTITDYSGYYPEVGRNGRGGFENQIFNLGVDEGAYPTPRTFQFGAQVSF